LLVHDLRNPLAALLAWLELLQLQGVKPEAHDALEGASTAARRLRELVDDLLQARLLEDGALQAALSPEPIADVARAAAATVHGLAAEKGISVHLELPDEPLIVPCDRALLQRALENVLVNAIRHTPPEANVALRVASDPDCVTLEVSDEGPGIPDEERPLLFSKYGSSSLRRSGARRGHGLGLFLVGLVMQAHHGVVRASAGTQRGTRVVMSLPLRQSVA
ncbi:MAG: sensor histidine kinase, partial [Gemmatimonadaceae bacterium]